LVKIARSREERQAKFWLWNGAGGWFFSCRLCANLAGMGGSIRAIVLNFQACGKTFNHRQIIFRIG